MSILDYYVDFDAGSDGDGSSGSPWNTFQSHHDALAGDIGGNIRRFNLKGTTAATLDLSGWTNEGSTAFVWLRAWGADRPLISGSAAYGGMVKGTSIHVLLEGLDVVNTATAGRALNPQGTDWVAWGCTFQGTGGSGYAVFPNNVGLVLVACCLHNSTTYGMNGANYHTFTLVNCTVVDNGGTGVYKSATFGSNLAFNTVAVGNGTNWALGRDTTSCAGNASGDTTAPTDGGYVHNVNPATAFANYAGGDPLNGDYDLAASGSALQGAGASVDAWLAANVDRTDYTVPRTDWKGTAWASPPSIGWAELAGGGGGSSPAPNPRAALLT
ncbi:MAG: right-handed parallel beta-helix repeat-containing protein [Rhodobacterales bacterium]|nr:right-handed parallel beta-helix repeat-containing protein [Rhodobacterales bacterium]